MMNRRPTEPCKAYRSRAAELSLRDHLDPERAEWDAHAATCAACRVWLKEEILIVKALSEMPVPGAISVRGAVMARIRQPLPRQDRWRELAWGLSTGMAGIVIGLLISTPQAGQLIAASPSETGYSAVVVDDFDRMVQEIAFETVESEE